MKLSDVTAKLTSMKGSVVRMLAAGALAGAVFAAAPVAKAQRFAFGVQFGGPRYYAPPPPPPRYYGYGYGAYGSNGYGYRPYGYGYNYGYRPHRPYRYGYGYYRPY